MEPYIANGLTTQNIFYLAKEPYYLGTIENGKNRELGI